MNELLVQVVLQDRMREAAQARLVEQARRRRKAERLARRSDGALGLRLRGRLLTGRAA
jgi:hypothetical protein